MSNWLKRSQIAELPPVVYHGTTEAKGREIERTGILRPRGKDEPGNWSGGMFGGNPSHPEWVYCSFDFRIAEQYAKDIALRNFHQGEWVPFIAVVEAIPELAALRIDEDLIHESLQNHDNTPLSLAAWTALAKYVSEESGQPATVEELQAGGEQTFLGDFGWEQMSDSGYAQLMKDVAEIMCDSMTPQELMKLLPPGGTVAFAKPLRVHKVHFIQVGLRPPSTPEKA